MVSESECVEPALVLAKTAELVESVSLSVCISLHPLAHIRASLITLRCSISFPTLPYIHRSTAGCFFLLLKPSMDLKGSWYQSFTF